MEYIQHMFKWYGVRIDNIVTGISRKGQADAEERKRMETLVTQKYPHMIHVDVNSVMSVNRDTKAYEEFALSGDSRTWSREIMEIVRGVEGNEG